MAEFVKVASTSDLAPGQCKVADAGGKPIALCNVNGTFYALRQYLSPPGRTTGRRLYGSHDSHLSVACLAMGRHDGKEHRQPRHGRRLLSSQGRRGRRDGRSWLEPGRRCRAISDHPDSLKRKLPRRQGRAQEARQQDRRQARQGISSGRNRPRSPVSVRTVGRNHSVRSMHG